VLSRLAVDGHQMYFGGSVVGKASTVGIEISPPLHRESKSAKFGVVFNITRESLNFESTVLSSHAEDGHQMYL